MIDLGRPYISARLPTSMLLSTVVISNSLYHIHITYKSLSRKYYAAPLSYMHRRQFQVDMFINQSVLPSRITPIMWSQWH